MIDDALSVCVCVYFFFIFFGIVETRTLQNKELFGIRKLIEYDENSTLYVPWQNSWFVQKSFSN